MDLENNSSAPGKSKLSDDGISPVPVTDHSDSSDTDDDFVHAGEEDYFGLGGGSPVTCPVPHSDGQETLNAIFPCHVDALFTMLFTNSKFFLDLHASRNSVNVNQSDWDEDPQTKRKRRVVSMTVSLSNLMGPKHAHVTETQLMLPVSRPGLFYAIDSESVNAGIPYADAFVVTIHYCMTRLSSSETRLVVVNSIKYKKSVWGIAKSIIEKNCWAGLEEFYSHLGRALEEECNKMRLIGPIPIPSPKNHDGGGGGQVVVAAESSTSIQRRRQSGLRNGSIVGVKEVHQDNNKVTNVIGTRVNHTSTETTVADGEVNVAPAPYSGALKILLCVLGVLLLLNAFVFLRLSQLENVEPSFISPQTFTFNGELPHSHQEWLTLLKKQEALHREELRKWHNILVSALRVLQNAQSDLESLQQHISTYQEDKYSLEDANEIITGSDAFSEKDKNPSSMQFPLPAPPETHSSEL